MVIKLHENFNIPNGVEVYKFEESRDVSVLLPFLLQFPNPFVLVCEKYNLPISLKALQINNVLLTNVAQVNTSAMRTASVRVNKETSKPCDVIAEGDSLVFILKETPLINNSFRNGSVFDLHDFMENDFTDKDIFSRNSVVNLFAPLDGTHLSDSGGSLDQSLKKFVKYKEFTFDNIERPEWDTPRNERHLDHLVEEDDSSFGLFVPLYALDKVTGLQIMLHILNNVSIGSIDPSESARLQTIISYIEQFLNYKHPAPLTEPNAKETVTVGTSSISTNPLD